MPRRNIKRLAIAAVIVVIFTVGVFIAVQSTDRYPASQAFHDDTIVTVRKVTYGKIHRYVEGNILKRIGAKMLPESLQTRFGIKTLSFTNSTESIAVWIETRTNVTVHPNSAGGIHRRVHTIVTLADENGGDLGLGLAFNINASTNVMIEAHQIPLAFHPSNRLQFRIVHMPEIFGPPIVPAPVKFETPNPAPRFPPAVK